VLQPGTQHGRLAAAGFADEEDERVVKRAAEAADVVLAADEVVGKARIEANGRGVEELGNAVATGPEPEKDKRQNGGGDGMILAPAPGSGVADEVVEAGGDGGDSGDDRPDSGDGKRQLLEAFGKALEIHTGGIIRSAIRCDLGAVSRTL
jgi:hypothetical protein